MRLITQLQFEGFNQQVEALAPGCEVIFLDANAPIPDDLTADALLTLGMETANLATLMRPQHGIGWVHAFGTGIDGFPLNLVEHCLLTCSRGASAVAIAEWVMAMMLSHEKQLPESWINGPGENWYFAPLGTLEGKTLSLLGFGNIGQAIARHAISFGMRVKALQRTYRDSAVEGVEIVRSLDELVTGADHLVLAAPAVEATRHIMNKEILSQCDAAHLINISRGSLVDQEALRWALDHQHIVAASLDVTEPEPLPEGHWLYEDKRVRLSPHISWNSPVSMNRMLQLFYDNLHRYDQQKELDGIVDTQAGY